jgi:hypothetical protein
MNGRELRCLIARVAHANRCRVTVVLSAHRIVGILLNTAYRRQSHPVSRWTPVLPTLAAVQSCATQPTSHQPPATSHQPPATSQRPSGEQGQGSSAHWQQQNHPAPPGQNTTPTTVFWDM